ncbi:hypothetical protein BDW67DRAFT_189435 [Aspergillus spinulosporus]
MVRKAHYNVDEPVPASSATHLALFKSAGLRDDKGFVVKCLNLKSYRHGSGALFLLSLQTYHALLGVKGSLEEIWHSIRQLKPSRDVAAVKWPSLTEFVVLDTLHIPIFLLEDLHKAARDVDLSRLLPSSLNTLRVIDAVQSTCPSLFLSLLNYMKSGPTQITEFIVATTHVGPARDAVRTIIKACKQQPNLTADEISHPTLKVVAKLVAASNE